MALVIENGTGVSGADSYVTVAECEAYAIAYYGHSLTGSPADKEAALRRAVKYMDSLKWKGAKTFGRGQSLTWPRKDVTDCEGIAIADNEIPPEVIAAQHEFARAEFQSPGILSPQSSLRDSVVNMEKIDVIQVGYDTSRITPSIDASQTIVSVAMRRIACFLVNGGRVGVRMTDARVV